MTGNQPLLRVDSLKKTYINKNLFSKEMKVNALKGVSFELCQGETLAIVGESGCGKSTLAKCLLKIESPTSGKILFKEQNLNEISSVDLCRKIQMIFQDPYSSLNPRKKIIDIIAEPLLIQGKNRRDFRDEVIFLIEKVGLRNEIADRFPHMLSGGQRQRVGIARALITQPQIIVCDEPVSALDVSVQAQVLNLLLDLQKEFKLSYIFISHDLSVVRFIADRVAVINGGEIVEINTTPQLFENPNNEYTRRLLDCVPHI